MRILASGNNILTQMNVFRFSVSQGVLLPMSFNLATLHPRLLQQHALRLLQVIDETKLSKERKEKPDSILSAVVFRDNRMQTLRALPAAKSQEFNTEQTEAVAKSLLWCRDLEVTFNIEHGIGNDAVLNQLQKLGQKSSEMKFVGSLPFFVRGPPGTRKSTLVSSLIYVALKGHKAPMRTGERGILPTALRRVLVLPHTNAAVDELLVEVINSREFKRSNTHEPLIRIGLHTTYDVFQSLTPGEIARSRSRNTGPVRGAARLE